MSHAELRVGIVGVGWGVLVHAPAYDVVDGYRVTAICSRRADSVAAAAAKLSITDTATDWRSFVHRDDLDVISISAPVDLHHAMFLEALAAGKHVLCEKPLALNAREALEMATASESTDRASLVCFENRWSPERLAIKGLVSDGVVGKPSFAVVAITSGSWHPTHRPMSAWMYRKDEGGGYLMGQMSHEIDFLQSIFGPVIEVAADVRHSIDEVETAAGRIVVDADDTSGLLLRFGNGALAVLANSTAGLNASTSLWEIHGKNGSIVVNRSREGSRDGGLVSQVGDAGPKPLVASPRQLASGRELPPRRSSHAVHAMALMLEDWLPGITDGAPTPVPTIRDGARVQQVIDAAWRSSEGAGWIKIDTADA